MSFCNIFLFNTVRNESLSSSLPEQVSEKKKSEHDEIPVIYSDNDLSKLASKQIKAEIMGDTQLAEKLKKQLEEARELVKERGFAKQPSKKVEEEVILTKVDSHGHARPIQMPQDKIESYKVFKIIIYYYHLNLFRYKMVITKLHEPQSAHSASLGGTTMFCLM